MVGRKRNSSRFRRYTDLFIELVILPLQALNFYNTLPAEELYPQPMYPYITISPLSARIDQRDGVIAQPSSSMKNTRMLKP